MYPAGQSHQVERMVALNNEHRAHAIEPIHRIFESEPDAQA